MNFLRVSLWAWLLGTAAAQQERLYINYAHEPRAADLLAYETCILDPHAKVDLKPGQALGHQFYAYLSLVELATGSLADDAAMKRGVPLVGQNKDWASHVLEVQHGAWWDFLLEDCAAPAVALGYDGFFLDTADSAALLPGGAVVHETRLVQLITALHERWPQKRIILNRGFALLPRLKEHLHGVMIESVYESFDPQTKQHTSRKPSDSAWSEARIKEAHALGLKVYAVDYTPIDRIDLARAAVKKLEALGCVALVTTPELRGTVIAPKGKR